MKRNGIRTVWSRGERTTSGSTDRNGRFQMTLGKHGGPVIKQLVVKTLEPKEGM